MSEGRTRRMVLTGAVCALVVTGPGFLTGCSEDPDAGTNPIQLSLGLANGTLTLATTNGLSITGGNNNTGSVTLLGTIAHPR